MAQELFPGPENMKMSFITGSESPPPKCECVSEWSECILEQLKLMSCSLLKINSKHK